MPSELFDDATRGLDGLAAAASDATILEDLAGTITAWDDAAERIFGYSKTEAIGQSIRLIVPLTHYDTVGVRKDGEHIDVSLTISPLVNAGGEIVGASNMARVSTGRKRLERHARHLIAIVESSRDAIISKDLDGTITSWNPGAERLFGYPAAAAVGQSIRLIIPADRLAEEDGVLDRLRRGEMVAPFETVRRRQDGTLVPMALTVSPIHSSTGEIIGASKIARDVTDAESAQRDSARLAAIVDSSDDGIISKDLDGIVTSWNRSAETMFGYTASEMIGRSIRRIVPDSRQQEEEYVLSCIRRGERIDHYETVRRRKDGTLIPISLTVSPIRNADGTVIGASKIARDIGERKRAEEERQRLIGLAQVKSEFLANMSHELRTPLNAIIGFAELMHRGKVGPVSATHEEYLGDILTSSRHLLRLINDVLDLAKVESGRIDFHPEPVDLATLVNEVRDTLRQFAASQGVGVTTDVDPTLTAAVVDPARLRQILYNYLSNAIKFTPSGGQVRVAITQNGPDMFRIDVEDTGVGIADSDLPKLFVEFRQLEGGTAKPHQGTGLGLALVKRIAEAQGGSVAVRSVPGEGSTFSAIVPRRMTPVVVGDVSAIAPPSPGNQTVLVVDDDPATLKLAAVALRELGHRPVCKGNGMDALLAAAADPPAVVIVDLLMPPMDGFEFISRLRALHGQSDVPILVWTIKDLTDSERRELKTAAAIVPKSAGGVHALVEELRRLLPPAPMTAAD